jgi:hypothetical protein
VSLLSLALHVGNSSQAQSSGFLTVTAAATATTDAWLSIRLWYGTTPIFNVSALLSALLASLSPRLVLSMKRLLGSLNKRGCELSKRSIVIPQSQALTADIAVQGDSTPNDDSPEASAARGVVSSPPARCYPVFWLMRFGPVPAIIL